MTQVSRVRTLRLVGGVAHDTSMEPIRPAARPLATACIRRARHKIGLTQDELAKTLGTNGRVVRRRESGKVDLGVLESSLLNPRFALALAEELRAKALQLLAEEPSELKEAA